jgi:NADH-quinone oxidoreductase subunit F
MSGRIAQVCQETPCLSRGSREVYEALRAEVEAQGLPDARVDFTGCHGHGLCGQGPSVVVEPDGIFYIGVDPRDAAEIVASHLGDGRLVERLLYRDPATGAAVPHYADVNFYSKQTRLILRNCGRINPERIEDYLLHGGYGALEKALAMGPQGVIDEVRRAGLRGRGGAGFPTARKWEFCRNAPGDRKYMICNADEGDPGAFMDRSILEADPHALIEGMIIAGLAIGASEGYIYVRAEYPLAVKRVKMALAQARERGYVGRGILGSGFDFALHVKEGAGAFVCGEETALIASIESRRGMPRPRPPFPAQSGLDGKPTIINNVKTLASVPVIIGQGAEWYAGFGTEKSQGTAVFALTGKVANSGLIEVPMGTPLSTIVFDIGGGVLRGKQLKAVQTGGPSGGCIPAHLMDLPVEYETLAQKGSIMGSGGMVVLDEHTCMVEVARYFVSFTQTESCGKCAPCRLGTRQMLQILTRITHGRGREEDIDTLATLAKTVKETALCGLGQTCPNPVLSTINNFRGEYEAHIREKKCSAAVCDAMMISPCQHTCPVGINVPQYVAQIADGDYVGAVETIRERNPFPAVCGRICDHACEFRCRRGELDDPVAIRALKRFAADWYFQNVAEPPEPFPLTRRERVAVVGAGPTGLSCAYFVRKMGYSVTVFEALPIGGGMLGVAVPEFRLSRSALQREIDYIAARGVEIRYNTPISAHFTVEGLRKQGFDAVFIAAGAQRSQRIGIPGEIEEIDGLHYGLRFLRDAKLGRNLGVGRRVAIVGGGRVALDAARTAIRLGAEEVEVYERMARSQLTVTEEEYEEARAEGTRINFLTSPTRVVNRDWKVVGLECIRMRLGEPGADGRRPVHPVPGSEFFAEADTVVISIGQAPDLSFLPADSALERTRWERLAVDANRLATSLPGVFAGGDFVAGPGVVIQGIAAGRRAAIAIDKYLKADASRVDMYDLRPKSQARRTNGEEDQWSAQPRVEMPQLSLEERRRTFGEIELGFSEERARYEAKRCLRCDLET